MAHLIRGSNITEVWRSLLGHLLSSGKLVSPRGQNTRESLNVTIEVSEGLNNIILSEARSLNYRYLVAEWLWMQAGLDEVAPLLKYNRTVAQFALDEGETAFAGAYGPRLQKQWPYIVGQLEESKETRQAVSVIWTPNPKKSKDIPCTLSFQWFIRDGKLHTTVNMRSSDAWLGLPYDFFSFSQLTNTLSSQISVSVGSVTMNLGSSHLYERDELTAIEVLQETRVAFLTSPRIDSSVVPTTEQVRLMLAGVGSGFMVEPWTSYGRSLLKDKKDCLKTLFNMSLKEKMKYE